MNEQTQFKIDTSGAVIVNQTRVKFDDLTPFMQGAEGEARRELAERLMREGMTAEQAREATAFHRWHPSALQRVMADCERYCTSVIAELCNEVEGRWFWRAHNLRDDLKDFPPLTISLAEDGLIHLSEVG